jgi:hypothetical protein
MKKTITEKKVVLVSDKKWVGVVCDPDYTVKDIMDRLNLGQLKMVGFRNMADADNERYWRHPNGEKMGTKAHGWTHHTAKAVGTSAVANLLYNTFEMWRKKADGLQTHLIDIVKPGTAKKLDTAVKPVKTKAVITITFSGTVAEVEAAIKEYAKCR